MRWAWVASLWLLVLLTGNLLHPLTHDASGLTHDCLVCTLQSLPALPGGDANALQKALEPAWEPLQRFRSEPSLVVQSPQATQRVPRAPPIA